MGRGEKGARSRLRRLCALGILWAIAQACNVDTGPSRCLNPQPLPPYCGNGSNPGLPAAEDGGPTANVGADAAFAEDASTGGGPSGEGGLGIISGDGAAGDAGMFPPVTAGDAGSDGGGTAFHVEDAGLDGAVGDAAADADAQGATDAPAPDAGQD